MNSLTGYFLLLAGIGSFRLAWRRKTGPGVRTIGDPVTVVHRESQGSAVLV